MQNQLEKAKAIINNDQKALKKLYMENFWKIKHYVLQNSGNEDSAKDVYQEAFVALWRNLKKGKFTPENENALENYLFQIAKNKWLDQLRKVKTKKETQLDTFNQIQPQENNFSEEIESDFTEKYNLAMTAFASMGRQCKELLTQFYFEKKSMNEIAKIFSINENSARNKKYRCVQKLRELVIQSK